ncbi:MAG: sodium-dependent transporter [Sedimentibacter sp.]|uniref:sodium-dependent transporter n=1 Tax=Sedimentibacter sp. TaxID=1960295 RepID=UPI002980CC06|nr:sodium-dependent transporter [Sedimentibacter sp.]MDW5300261.1 sodium-dependent transporter [Sedimentibacter sp.]
MNNENSRGQWGSNFGFLMAAVGSAVGLGNIWGFPYKMGANGGFAFLIVYLAMVTFVGFATMLGELALGRKTGLGVIGTYKVLYKKFAWVGWLGFLSGFLILGFYSVLGGYTLRYALGFLMEIFSKGAGFGGMGSGEFFGSFIINGGANVMFHAIFMGLTIVIVMGGISGGIEKFTKIAMPALLVMLLIVIIRSLTLEGASTGVAFMFAPNFAAFSEIGFMKVLKTAAGQMFFSLSLGMGCMITYGSYLSKSENLEKNALIIPIADTIFALLAGLAVMPAVGAFMSQGVEGISFGAGPGLLFVTLHQVFSVGMGGFIGNLFGFVFYFLVFIAAVTSSISLLEVCTAFFIDRNVSKGVKANRKMITIITGLVVFAVGVPVCLDGLGSGVAGGATIDIPAVMFGMSEVRVAFDCWLDFYDMIAEGVFMPLGAILMSVMIGWILKTDIIKSEVEEGGIKMKAYAFWDICFKFIVPIGILFVLMGQLDDFFGLGIF